jgi:antitoxin VapB
MGTQLNIKGEEAYRLAASLSELTGESMTAAVTRALQERLDHILSARAVVQRERQALAEELLAIGRACAADLTPPFHSADHADLYGDDGLPV